MSDDKTSRSETDVSPRQKDELGENHPPQKAKKDIITSWREKNIIELDKNLSTWKAIRDDCDASDKDRIEAAKAIARQMGALSPDAKKTEKEERRDDAPVKPKLKDAHSRELEALLDAIV
jgi:hypothetical protein